MVIDVKRHRCYRECLREFYLYKKSQRESFSYREFSKRAGFKSPNFIQLLIQKKRNLSNDNAERLANVMKLTRAESDYFCGLVAFENSSTTQEKESSQRDVLRAIKQLVKRQIPTAQVEVLSTWHHLVIREMISLPDFKPSGKWISQRLRGLISPDDAESSLKALVEGGFLKVAPTGNLFQQDPVIDTGDAFNQERVLNFHLETLKTWTKILPGLTPAERELALINIPVSTQKIPELKQRMRAFQDEIIGWLSDEKEPNQIIQLGTYLIPITRG